MTVVQGPGRLATKQHLIDTDQQGPGQQSLAHRRLEVARLVQFFMQPGFFKGSAVGAQFIVLTAIAECLEHRFCRQHASLDRGVATLDSRGIEEACVTANQSATREGQFGQGLQATGGDRTGAVGQAFATFEELANFRMGLVALKLFVWRQVRVFVRQADHITDCDLIVFQVIQERATVGTAIERPTSGMHHQARLMQLGVDFPDLLDTDGIGLRILASIQLEFADQLLAQMAPRALGKEGVLGMQFHTQLKCRGRLTVTIHAHIAGGNALDGTILVVQHFSCRKTRKHFDPQRLGLLSQPAHHIRQRDHVVAMVLEAFRQQPGRGLVGLVGTQEQETVFAHRRSQRRTTLLPVREQFGQCLWIHDRA